MATAPRPILFLTDYGLDDEFAGVCRAVIARLAPGAEVIDVAHGIPPGDVLRGAAALAAAAPYAPAGAVWLAVVDPGVGTERRAIAVEAGGAHLVGPDNGLLSLAWEALGGASRAFAIESREVRLQPVSATFQGRDVFAPAAAHLARGLPPEALGPSVAVQALARVEEPRPEVEPGRVVALVLAVDRFGNVQLAAAGDVLEEAGLHEAPRLEVVVGGNRIPARVVRTFADIPAWSLGILVDSTGRLALARNGESAAAGLGARPGAEVLITLPGHGRVIPLPGPR